MTDKSTQPAPDAELLTKHELAARIKKTTRTVDKWMSEGRLPYLKVGRTVLFDWSEVRAYMQNRFHHGGETANTEVSVEEGLTDAGTRG